jgi:hypothetical protein
MQEKTVVYVSDIREAVSCKSIKGNTLRSFFIGRLDRPNQVSIQVIGASFSARGSTLP